MKITKSQLKQIIKEELDSTLKEAGSPRMPKSPGLLRAIWDMLKDEFEDDPDAHREPRSPEEDPDRWRPDNPPAELTPEEEEEKEREEWERRHLNLGRKATSHRDAYYRGGTYDPTLEEAIRQEVRKLLRGK